VNAWRDRSGDVVGASVFLTPDEVDELQDTGTVEISIEE